MHTLEMWNATFQDIAYYIKYTPIPQNERIKMGLGEFISDYYFCLTILVLGPACFYGLII